MMKTVQKITIGIVLLLMTACSKTDLYEYPSNNSDKTEISSFRLIDENAVSVIVSSEIKKEDGAILVKIKKTADLTKLYPTAVVSEGVIVEPQMGYLTDFTKPVQYKLIAGNRKTSQLWTITVIFDN